MSGIEIFSSSGAKTYSTTDTTWNYVGSFTAAANTIQYFFPSVEMGEYLVTRLMLNQVTGDDEAYVHDFYWGYSWFGGRYLYALPPSSTDTVATLFVIFGR